MFEASVYYCWSCDAHRKTEPAADGRVQCPRCERELTPDCRLPARDSMTACVASEPPSTIKITWPAPVRPRLAASA